MTQTMVTGHYRIVVRDNNDNHMATILEQHSSAFGGVLGTPQADPQKMPKVKPSKITAAEDDKIVIMFKPDTTRTEHTTSTAAADTVRVPVRIMNLRTKYAYEKQLDKSDFTDRRAYANSQVWTSGVWYDIWSLTVGAQLAYRFGHMPYDARVDSALNLQKDVTTS